MSELDLQNLSRSDFSEQAVRQAAYDLLSSLEIFVGMSLYIS